MTHRTISLSQVDADALEVALRIRRHGGESFLVGGAVRDLLLGRRVGDYDIASNLEPLQVAKLFPFSVPTGIAHGTVTVWLNAKGEGHGYEVTTYRGDVGYSDGRRPDRVEFKQTIEEDLARRDFTINAIAAQPQTGVLVDPYAGLIDLEQRLLRAVRDPLERFGEDGLRPMRAVRFAAQLGFAVEPLTFAAIAPSLPVTERVSVERLRDELMKLLGAPKPSVGLTLMRASGLMRVVLPELIHPTPVWDELLSSVDAATQPHVRLAALLHAAGADTAEHVMRRLKFSNNERERLCHLLRESDCAYVPEWSDGEVRRFIARVGPEHLDAWLELRAARAGHGDVAALRARLTAVMGQAGALSVKELAVDGADVMRVLGVGPSRAVKDTLDGLLRLVQDTPSRNNRAELLAELERMKVSHDR